MDGGELAAVIVTFVTTVAVAAVLVGVRALVVALREVRAAVEQLRAEALPALDDLRRTVAAADAEVARVDELLRATELVSERVDRVSRAATGAVSSPVIKVMAAANGARGVGKRLRSRDERPAAPSRRREG